MNNKKIVYVTGCLGFIGMHVTQMCLDQGWYVIGVDKGTYASNFDCLESWRPYSTFRFIQSDINDLDRLFDCDYVINTAAETHVDNSIISNDVFLRSNVNGVHHVLELIKQHTGHRVPILLHFSTDEVYGDIESGSHKETSVLQPSNPYAATKAAADMLILAWSRTYGLPYVIVRPTNNYGPGQYVEKLIPRSVKSLMLGRKLEVHDLGEPRRTWLHVSDTAAAIQIIIGHGVRNEIFNISGSTELPNREVVQKILSHFYQRNITTEWTQHADFVQRPGQDVRYSIDDTKLRALGWSPKAGFDQELQATVDWYRKNWIW